MSSLMQKVCCAFLATLLVAPLSAEPAFSHVKRKPVIGVMGISEETETLESLIEKPKVEIHGNFRFISGTLLDKKIILAQVGFGKANSAAGTAILLNKYDVDCVIFSGTAGALNPDYIQGDVVVASDLVQHDLGQVSKEGFTVWQANVPVDGLEVPKWLSPPDSLMAVAREAGKAVKLSKADQTPGVRGPTVWEGVIATGDSFVSEPAKGAELRRRFQADAVEMEGAAVAQVCYQAGIPCLVIRSLTDRADGTAYLTYQKFAKIAGRNAAALVWEIVSRLEGADLPSKNAPKNRQSWCLISGLNFAEGAPYSSKFSEFPDLLEGQKQEISSRAFEKMVNIALQLVPARRVGLAFHAGATGDGPVGLSAQVLIEGTREEARSIASILGYLGQRSTVMGVTETGPYARHALLVENFSTNGWSNIETLRSQWPELAGKAPMLCLGFTRMPTSLSDGLLIIDTQGSWPYTTWYDGAEQLRKAAESLFLKVRVTRVSPAFLRVQNSWADAAKGEVYLDNLKRTLDESKVERLKQANAEVEAAYRDAIKEVMKRKK